MLQLVIHTAIYYIQTFYDLNGRYSHVHVTAILP